jgi:hypothetical protein
MLLASDTGPGVGSLFEREVAMIVGIVLSRYDRPREPVVPRPVIQ